MAKAIAQSGAVFERYENKFLLDRSQYQGLLRHLRGRMEQDSYGLHTIRTLYYDTDDFAIIRRCLEKPKFREKLRLRSYGAPSQDSTVYLELKKKFDGITYKRRVPLSLSQAQDYLLRGRAPADQGQIFREIDWYVRRRPLEAKALICYDRIALFGLEDPALRTTIDAEIRFRDSSLALDRGDHGHPLLPPETYLMEVKTLHALPLWFARLLSEWKAYPTPFSKYGTVFQEYLQQKEGMRDAV